MPTQDVSIWDETQTKAVSVITDGSVERLAVDSNDNGKDYWTESVELGKGFVVTTNYISISGTTETNFLLLHNPTGSAKLVRIHEIYMSVAATVTGDNARVRCYRDPTVTANGTALTIRPLKKTGNNAVSTLAYTAPTTSSLGTLMWTKTLTQAFMETMHLEESFYIQANERLLITIQPANTGKNHAVTVFFMEETA
jgi:hypothetical protein